MCNIDDADGEYLLIHQSNPVAAWPHKCGDCGRTIPVGERYERVEWAEWSTAEHVDELLALPFNDPVRQWIETRRGRRDRPFDGDDTLIEYTAGTEIVGVQCDHCRTAGRWLDEVCSGYLYATACEELAEHWDEDPVYHCRALARLVLYSGARFEKASICHAGPIVTRCRRNPWTDRNGDLIPVATVDQWVSEALDVYRHAYDTALEAA